jgi:hypothetical protein
MLEKDDKKRIDIFIVDLVLIELSMNLFQGKYLLSNITNKMIHKKYS